MRGSLLALLVLLTLAGAAGAGTAQPRVLAIRFGPDLVVNPVTQDYLTSKLSRAADAHYDAAVILLDTPGGLSSSMKTIYTHELASKIPVIVYERSRVITPTGRVCSARAFPTQSS